MPQLLGASSGRPQREALQSKLQRYCVLQICSLRCRSSEVRARLAGQWRPQQLKSRQCSCRVPTGRYGARPARQVRTRSDAISQATEHIPAEPHGSDSTTEPSLLQQYASTLASSPFFRTFCEAAPFATLMFLLTFANIMVDQAKDAMVLNVMGAKCIPFFQLSAVLPMSILFLGAYQQLVRVMPRRALFPVIIGTLVSLKLLAVHFLLPQALAAVTAAQAAAVPSGSVFLSHSIAAMFYGLSELFADIVIGFLFWGFAIQVIPEEKAKLLFPVFCVGAQLAQMASGAALSWVASELSTAIGQMQVMCALCAAASLLAMGLHEVISQSPCALAAAADSAKAPRVKKSPNPITALQYCRENDDVRPLAVMAVCSGVVSNLLEFSWKVHLTQWLTTPEAMTAFMGKVATTGGFITLCLIPVATWAFEKLGWSRTAKATPNLLLTVGVPFFIACGAFQFLKAGSLLLPMQGFLLTAVCVRLLATLFADSICTAVLGELNVAISRLSIYNNGISTVPTQYLSVLTTVTPIRVQVAGAALSLGYRSAKFALYKPAEEQVYKKLDERGRTEGKASVDVVAAQCGKTGSSFCTQLLLAFLPLLTMTGIMGVFGFVFAGAGSQWRNSIGDLSGKMDKKIEPVTAASLEEDAVEWGARTSDCWGECAVESGTSGDSTTSGDSATMPDAGVRGNRQFLDSDEELRQPGGIRCSLDPVLA